MVVMMRSAVLGLLEVFMEGTGNPEDEYKPIGVKWMDPKGIEHSIGDQCNKFDLLVEN